MAAVDLKRVMLLACAATVVGAAAPPERTSAERATPSGLPVPRYISLKFAKVNARAGPGDDHRLMWVYRVKGLPVQVVAETSEWRRICDPTGGMAWVHRRVTDGKRQVMNVKASPVPLLRQPKAGASTAVYLNSRALGALVRCDKGWCKIRADGATGWAREGALWGTAQAPQCR